MGASVAQIDLTTGNDTFGPGSSPDADTIYGLNGNDTIQGVNGVELIYGGNGDDSLCGDAYDDIVEGGDGQDFVTGGLGNDQVNGGGGDDSVYGGQGNDVVSGGEGADVLSGDRGDDTLVGGAGPDVFLLAAESGRDEISDFIPGEDRIQLDLEEASINGIPIASFADLLARIVDTPDGAFIDLGDGQGLLLPGVTRNQLTPDDFVFV